jgi:hypothetical protein
MNTTLPDIPIANVRTRFAVATCPARGVLCVTGYDAVIGADLPEPVTQTRALELLAPA